MWFFISMVVHLWTNGVFSVNWELLYHTMVYILLLCCYYLNIIWLVLAAQFVLQMTPKSREICQDCWNGIYRFYTTSQPTTDAKAQRKTYCRPPYTSCFPGKPGLASPSDFLHLFWTKTVEDKRHGCFTAVTQPTVSKHWRFKALISTTKNHPLVSSFLDPLADSSLKRCYFLRACCASPVSCSSSY